MMLPTALSAKDKRFNPNLKPRTKQGEVGFMKNIVADLCQVQWKYEVS